MPDRNGKTYTTKAGVRYEKHIKSKAWARKRVEYWEHYGKFCQMLSCQSKTNLHVHHHTYDRLGNERLEDLLGLCETHHMAVHDYHDSHKVSLTRATEIVTGVDLKVRPAKQKPKKLSPEAEAVFGPHKTKPRDGCACRYCKEHHRKDKKKHLALVKRLPYQHQRLVGQIGPATKPGVCTCGEPYEVDDRVRFAAVEDKSRRVRLALQKVVCVCN